MLSPKTENHNAIKKDCRFYGDSSQVISTLYSVTPQSVSMDPDFIQNIMIVGVLGWLAHAQASKQHSSEQRASSLASGYFFLVQR